MAGFIRAGVMAGRAADAARIILTRHRLNYTLLIAGSALVVCSLLVWELERGSDGGNIKTVADALWWGLVTITTVGYGDRFPTTAGGRGIGAILLILGIVFFGFLTATLSSFMVEKDRKEDTDPQLAEINERLARIEEALALRPPSERPDDRVDG
jgi:voltage-gated potassium channel